MEINSKIHVEQLAPPGMQRSESVRRDRQTDKKLTVFGPPRRLVKSEPHQTWHGDRGPRARSCSSKSVWVRRMVAPLRDAENLAET